MSSAQETLVYSSALETSAGEDCVLHLAYKGKFRRIKLHDYT